MKTISKSILVILTVLLIGCGSKYFEPFYAASQEAKAAPKVKFLEEREYPASEAKTLTLDLIHGTFPEKENYFNNPGALFAADSSAPSVIISIPNSESNGSNKSPTKQTKPGDIYKSDGYYNEAEQAIEGALIRQGFNVLDRSKFEAKLRDLRDRGNHQRYWWTDYKALIETNKFDKVRDILNEKLKKEEITSEQYVQQTEELNKISTVGLPGKNREKGKSEMNDIAEVIRATQTGHNRAQYLMQINGVSVEEVSSRTINISDRKEVLEFLKECPGLRLGKEANDLPPTLKTPWLRVEFNAKLIHIKSGSIVWLGTHSLESPAAQKIRVKVQVTKKTSNGNRINTAIRNYNVNLKTKMANIESTRSELGKYYRAAATRRKFSNKKEVEDHRMHLSYKITELEGKLEGQIKETERFNAAKPKVATEPWSYAYSTKVPIYNPNFLLEAISRQEGLEKLKVHQSKLIKTVASSLIKTIIIKYN